MAWSYADYERQSGDQAIYDRLVLHIEEVVAKQGGKQAVSGGGMYVQFSDQYLARLDARRKELEQRLRRFGSGRSPLSVADMSGRPR